MCPNLTATVAMSVPASDTLREPLAANLGLDPKELSVELYQHAMHDTYLLNYGEVTSYFKLYRHALSSRARLVEELKYLSFLISRKTAVASPLSGPRQDPILEIPCPEGARFGVIYEAVPGKFVPEPTEAHCRQYGRMLARIHELGIEYLGDNPDCHLTSIEPAANCRKLATLIDDRKWIPQKTRAAIKAAIRSIENQKFAALPQTLVHGDAHLGNVRFVRQTPALFDFDLMGLAPAAYDLAVYRWSRLLNGGTADETRLQWGAFLAGYRSVRDLTNEEREFIPGLTTARHIWFISYMIESSSTHGRVWFENAQPRILKHLELCAKKDDAS